MIGNDVVDLRDPEARAGSLHPRFDTRVFAPAERAALAASDDPHRLRWLLWAAKEAAYKVARKLDPAAVFSPPRFLVQPHSTGSGVVVHAGRRFALWWEADGERVHAVASDAPRPEGAPCARAAALPDPAVDPSAAVRALARRGIARLLGAHPERLSFARAARIPVLCLDAEPAPGDLSLSHHGRWVAWAWDPRGGAAP